MIRIGLSSLHKFSTHEMSIALLYRLPTVRQPEFGVQSHDSEMAHNRRPAAEEVPEFRRSCMTWRALTAQPLRCGIRIRRESPQGLDSSNQLSRMRTSHLTPMQPGHTEYDSCTHIGR